MVAGAKEAKEFRTQGFGLTFPSALRLGYDFGRDRLNFFRRKRTSRHEFKYM